MSLIRTLDAQISAFVEFVLREITRPRSNMSTAASEVRADNRTNSRKAAAQNMPDKAIMETSVKMLPDGSNPEGVSPQPPLGWITKSDLQDVIVHGPAFSHATTKLRTFLVFAGVPFRHEQHLKAKPQGIKPDSSYRKVPVIDVAGRQVNDSWIILQNLLPALGIEIDAEWEERIVLELDTTFKLHCTSTDWARLAVATVGAPSMMKWLIGPMLKRMERKQALHNIATTGLGHREGDERAIARDFKRSMAGVFHGGSAPDHVDLSLYGFLAGYLYAGSPMAKRMVAEADLGSWVTAMKTVVPLQSLFPGTS